MPIDRIYIKNYKSIRDSGEIKIRPLNVLIGSNGVGKSNFIGFFKLLNSISEDRLKSFVAENGYADKILHFGQKKSKELAGGIVFRNETNTNNRYDFILKPDQQNNFFFEEEKGGYNSYAKGYNESWDYIPLEKFVGTSKSELSEHSAERFKHLREYFTQFNIFHFHDTGNSSPMKQPSRIGDNAWLRADGSNLAAFLYMISQRYPKHFRIIEQTIRFVTPFFSKFDLKPDGLNPDYIKLNWQEQDSDTYFDANNLSDGSLRFIALSTLLLQPVLPDTIIIDEPELGLHPSAIIKLAALIKMASAKSQVIISTQSINLLDQFVPENIIVVERQNNQSVFTRLESDKLAEWLSEYSIGELWDKNVIGGRP